MNSSPPTHKGKRTASRGSAKAAVASKGRIFLFHWKDTEIDDLARPLRAAGWEVAAESSDGARGGRAVRDDPPNVIVFYLTRLPSHSRATAHALRSMKATRAVPMVFVGGKDDAVAKTRELIPDAAFVAEPALLATCERFATA